jgi:hypothetical protein
VGLSLASSPDFDIESGLPGLLSGGLGPGRVCPGRSMRHSPCISRTLLPIASTSVHQRVFGPLLTFMVAKRLSTRWCSAARWSERSLSAFLAQTAARRRFT